MRLFIFIKVRSFFFRVPDAVWRRAIREAAGGQLKRPREKSLPFMVPRVGFSGILYPHSPGRSSPGLFPAAAAVL